MNIKHLLGIACMAGAASVAVTADAQDETVAGDSAALAAEQAEGGTKGYLGLSFVVVPREVRAQLDIDEGVGLLVRHLDAEGPAAAAGVELGDILVGFDDQIIISGAQLVTLVRNREPGSQAQLHVYRKGRRQALAVTLGCMPSTAVAKGAVRAPVPGLKFFFGDRGPHSDGGDATPESGPMRFQMEIDPQEFLEEMRRQLREHEVHLDEMLQGADDKLQGRLQRLFDARSEANEVFESDEGDALRIIESDHTSIHISDGEHRIFLNGRDGDFELVVRDTDDQLIYDGPYNGEEDFAQVPTPVRNKIEEARRTIARQRAQQSGGEHRAPEKSTEKNANQDGSSG